MRLYTFCKTCHHKFYIASPAKIRSDLPPLFFLTCPYHHNNEYYSRDISAETSVGNIAIGGVLAGGLMGLIAGGIGAIVGAIIGGLAGGGQEKQDIAAVDKFNKS